MQFWMIIYIAQTEDFKSGERVAANKAPRFMHTEKERAEKELLRLADKYSGSEFVLLESVARVVSRVERVCKIVAIDGVPF